jgi:uncharacterized protein YecE (DUF72 family)
MSIHVGTSGWSYRHWEGVLYPTSASPGVRLGGYVQRFDSVELNSSFYHWPRRASFAGWQRRLPEGFRLSVKAPRGLTHARKLYGPESWIQRITESWHALGERRGALLVQLPPQQPRDDARLAYFLDRLPPWMQAAVEFRHDSWVDESVFAMLEDHQVAYCVMSGAYLPCVLRCTAPFVYVRLHGPDHQHLYAGSYSDTDLMWWAERMHEWAASGKDVYAYFNNDGDANAVRNAQTLRSLLRQPRLPDRSP